MAKATLTSKIDKTLSPGDQIKQIADSFRCGATMKSAHLVNLALATMKYLLVNAESDDLRFKAAEALLALPPSMAKLGEMKNVVEQPYLGRDQERPAVIAKRLKVLMEGSPERAKELLAMVQEAEKQAKAAA